MFQGMLFRAALVGAAMLSLVSPALRAQDADANTPLDTVVITAERERAALDAERHLTPGSVTTVDGADLYQRSVTNLADLLRYVPGIWSESSSGADELFFSSRGSNLDATDYDKNGIKLLQDGLPVTTADGNNHNRVLDPLSARYATVAHGANALTYGASTLGGAIDFTSPTARTSDPLSLFAQSGSHGLLSGRITAGYAAESFDALGTVESRHTDGYRQHSELERNGFYGNAGWRSSEAVTTRFYATYLDYDEELPRALTRAQVEENPRQVPRSALTGDNRKKLETARAAFKTSWRIDEASSLQFGLSYEEQSLYHPIVDVRGDPDGPGPIPEIQFFSLLIDTDHRNVGGMIRYDTKRGDHDLLFGLNYGDTAVEGGYYGNLYGRRNGLNTRVREAADGVEAFAVDRWQVTDAWKLVYGAQLVDTRRDVRETETGNGAVRNPKGDYSAVNPRLGAIYSFNDTAEGFASVSRLFEAPTTFELQDDVRQNEQTLDPMKGTVVEVGVRGATSADASTRWHWDVAVYYAKIEDEILSIDDVDAPGTSLSTNIDSTTHAGIEALVGASFELGSGAHRLEPLVSFTLNEFSFDSDPLYGNSDLPAAPKYAARGELMYRHVSGFYAGPTFDFIGKRFADFSNTYTVDSYELLGLRGGYTGKRWEAFVELRNLLDEDYIATVGVRDRAAADAAVLNPGLPLSAYAGVRFKL